MNKCILIAADIHTHPIIAGNQQCIMQYVETLRTLGFDIYFLYIDLYEGNFINDETRNYWGDHFFYFKTSIYQTILQKIRRRIEHCYYSPHLDAYYPWGLTKYVNKLHEIYNFNGLIVNYIWNSKLANCTIPIKAIFTHDVFTNRNEKLGQKDAWYSYSKNEEARGIARFENVLSIQDVESNWYREIAPHCNVRTVYSSFTFVKQPICNNKNILFFSGGGKLNKDGIDKFIREVWPIILSKDDDVKLLIGGGICSCYKQEELTRGIVLMGKYANPSDFYKNGNICINPVFNGSGLKIKTFEALAHGKALIVNPHSALGVYSPNNIPLYRASTPQQYVDNIFRYLDNEILLIEQRNACEQYINKLNNYILRQYKEVFNI